MNGNDATYTAELDRVSQYAALKIDSVLKDMLEQIFINTPEDPIDFMIGFLSDYKERELDGPHGLSNLQAMDVDGDMDRPPISLKSARRRTAVSAEPVLFMSSADAQSAMAALVIPKSADQTDRIRESVKENILFSSLSSDQLQQVVDSMSEKKFAAGETIIRQGEQGDYFYVLDIGAAECFVSVDGASPKMVKTYQKGGSFGELALMYNSPRAATIVAKTAVVCWAVDRITFRKVLMDTASSMRSRYEQFLGKCAILQSLDRYERARIADALTEQKFKDGEIIIKQGETGDTFYIIAEGKAVVTKNMSFQVEPVTVLELNAGDYFGELALINDDKRAANVIAVGDITTVFLDRGAFNRLLGPIDHILQRNQDNYDAIESKIYNEKIAAVSNALPTGLSSLKSPSEPSSCALAARRRRTAVSSEPVAAMNSNSGVQSTPTHAKTKAQRHSILQSIKGNFLFASLDQSQSDIILEAMFEKKYIDGQFVIEQGQPGDNFYILAQGEAECFVQKNSSPPVMVKVYHAGEGFGELALMYNSPRAASIRAKGDITVWAVDRFTFRRVVMDTTIEKRTLYEGFLSDVKILSSLDRYELAKVADCLVEQAFAPGEFVIKQDEPGDNFYIVVEGEAIATKSRSGQNQTLEVMRYKRGDYFGELALLNDKPRAANVVASGAAPLKVVTLDRSSFVRLLGPCDEILKRNTSTYQAVDAAAFNG